MLPYTVRTAEMLTISDVLLNEQTITSGTITYEENKRDHHVSPDILPGYTTVSKRKTYTTIRRTLLIDSCLCIKIGYSLSNPNANNH